MAAPDTYTGYHEGREATFHRVSPGSNLFHLRSHRTSNVYALLISGDEVSCSCRGWQGHQHCWHSDLLRTLEPLQYLGQAEAWYQPGDHARLFGQADSWRSDWGSGR